MMLTLLLTFVSTAPAATLTVGGSGTYATIQDAIDASAPGDVVEVSSGTYAENIDFRGKDITVESVSGSGVTILSPATSGLGVVTFDEGEAGILDGFGIEPASGERGVYISNSSPTIRNCRIEGAGDWDTSWGGGIFVDEGAPTFHNIEFIDNEGAKGGDIYITSASNVTVTESTMEGSAGKYGASIFILDSALTISDTTSEEAVSQFSGGFAYLDGATFTATNLEVVDPLGDQTFGVGLYATGRSVISWTGGEITGAVAASYLSGYTGGAMHLADSSTLTATNVLFEDNTAYNGGSIDLQDGSTATLTNVTFENSAAHRAGGALRVYDSAEASCTDCIFDSNVADRGGAVDVSVDATYADTNGEYIDNAATAQDGGAIRVTEDGELVTTGSTFEGNEASQAGGALYLYEPGETVLISTSVFQNNVAESGDGGAILADLGASLTVEDSAFNDNSTTLGSGGAIAFDPVFSGHVLTVTLSSFESNEAEDDGGAIYSSDAEQIEISDVTFLRNRAPSGDGGALMLEQDEDHELSRVVFHANTASGKGGAIFDKDHRGETKIENCIFTENSGGTGGAIHISENAVQANLVNITFAGNDASSAGAHLYLDDATVSFVNNIAWAGQDGGGLYAADPGSASGSDFYYSDVGDNSGGDYIGSLSDPTGGSGNINETPLFRDFSIDGDEDNDNLYLFVGSPCIDSGDPSIVDVDGTRSDMGAYGGPNADAHDDDGDGHWSITDCNDDDSGIYPGAVELPYDGVDQDCDGSDLSDVDGDGFEAIEVGGTDCDDTAVTVFPGAVETWYDGIDSNCDEASDYDADGDTYDWDVFSGLDCDDSDAAIRPGVSDSVGDGIDQNCDGVDGTDADGDGYASIATGGVDCDDSDASIHPGALEIAYDGIDQDCDGFDLTDADGDGFDADSAGGTDCDDSDASVFPGAEETWYDGIDSDCNGLSDYDQDLDGYDVTAFGGDDCNDSDPLVHPGSAEIWYDGIDQNCDGLSDFDKDGDGRDALAHGGDDCADEDPGIYPGAEEIPYDGIDQDCDGVDITDVDGDGYDGGEFGPDCDDSNPTIYPGAVDTFYDGVDQNCDGVSDFDADADGHDSDLFGGDDCDDTDATVHPGVDEVWYDTVDDNCDGNLYDQDGDGVESADFAPGGTDCDDEDVTVYPGAEEILDGKDNDCDGYTEMDDRDEDGMPDWWEWEHGTDYEDEDSDGDGWLDGEEAEDSENPRDTDGDGIINPLDEDDDGDKISTQQERLEDADGDSNPDPDVDGDGIPNGLDTDSDGDGFLDKDEGTRDLDGDGIPDYVDYQGGFLGGGCTGCQSGGNGSAPLWLVVVGVACLLRRKETVAVIPAVGFVVLTSVAQAQDVELAAVDARGFWVADTAGDIRRSPRLVYPAVGDVWDAGMLVDMASEPLLEYQPDGVQVVVDTLITTHIYGGYDTGKFRFDASYPFTAYGHDQLGGFAASGDLRLGALWAFMAPDRGKPGVGVQVLSWLPTGTQGRWSGSPGVAAGGVVTLAQEIDRVGYTVNAGVRMGVPNNARNLVTGSSPIGGFEIHYVLPVLDDILAVGGEVAIQGATGFKSWPVEPGMRLRGRLPNGGFAMLGGAMGVGDGVGASKWRGFVGVGFGGIPPEAPPAQGTIVVPVILERIERAASNGPLAELVDNRIVIREQVFFREAKAEILPASQPILAAVAKVLEENPEIEHLLVEGHTNSRASRVYNRKLSQARAEAVAAWLEINGIDGARLIPKGFGEDRPLVKDSHPDAMVINRRVEFTVLRSDESGELNEAPDVKSLPSELQEDR